MSKIARAADGSIHRFPDNTPDAVMDQAMQDYAKQSNANNPMASLVSGVPQQQSTGTNAFEGAVEGLAQAGYGAGQSILMGGPAGMLARKAGDKLAELAGTDPHRELDVLRTGAQKIGTVSRESREDFERSAAGHSTMGRVARFAGEVAPSFLIPGGGVTKTQKVLSSVLGGMAGAQTIPVEDTQDFVSQRGLDTGIAGAAGGVLTPLAWLAKGTYRGAANLLGSKGEAVRRAGETVLDQATDKTKLLTGPINPTNVAGLKRTASQETLDSGLARLEQYLRGHGKHFDERDAANNQALLSELRKFAGDDTTLQKAIDAREAATSPLRTAAQQVTGVDTTRLLSQIRRAVTMKEGGPTIQGDLRKVEALIARDVGPAERSRAMKALTQFMQTGRRSSDARAAQQAMLSVRNGEVPRGTFTTAVGKQALADAQAAMRPAQDKVRALYETRMEIDKMLSGTASDSVGRRSDRELVAIKNQMDRVLAKHSPEFEQYLNTYRAASKDIDRMKVGQQLMGQKSGGAVQGESGEQVLTAARFSNQARNLDRTAQQATGFRKAKAGNILTPEDMQRIANVKQELQRVAIAQKRGHGVGSPTNARNELGDQLSEQMAGSLPFIGSLTKGLSGPAKQRMLAELEKIMLNPNDYRAQLAKLAQQQTQGGFIRAPYTSSASLLLLPRDEQSARR